MGDLHDDKHKRAERDTPPVIVACAVGEQPTADEAAVALRARGHVVDVVGGVEEDTELLAAAIRRHDRQGLYVLCRSPSLPRQRIDKLRSVLRGHEVPFGRTLTLAIESGQPRALEERIVSVARRMITGRPDSVRPPARPLPRPVVARVASAAEYDEVDTRVDEQGREMATNPIGAEEIARWADSLAGPLPSGEDQELDTASPTAIVPPGDSMEITQRNRPTGDLSSATEPPAYSGVETTQVAQSSRRPLETVPAPVIPVEPNSAPGISSFVGGHDPDDVDLDSAAYSTGRRLGSKQKLGLAVGAIAVLVVAVIGVAKLSSSSTSEDRAKDAVAKNERRESGDGDRSGEPSSQPEADAPVPDEEPAAAEPAADAAEPAAEADEPEPEVLPEPKGHSASEADDQRPTPALEDSPQVLAALRNRDVRAIDTLLVAAEVSKDGTHADAVAWCAALKVAELEGWRVPAIGELWTVGEAKIVKPGVYWSDTVGDAHGDKRLVLNSKRARIVPVDSSWTGAKAVCVRERS
jgi:hypothetical protein